MISACNRLTTVPEFSGDPAIRRILEHAAALPTLDLPCNLATELKIESLIVDGPTAVRLHVDAVSVEHLIQGFLPRQQADIGHSYQWQARPAISAHRTARSRLTDLGRGLSRAHIAHELT